MSCPSSIRRPGTGCVSRIGDVLLVDCHSFTLAAGDCGRSRAARSRAPDLARQAILEENRPRKHPAIPTRSTKSSAVTFGLIGCLFLVEIVSGVPQWYFLPLISDLVEWLCVRDADHNWFEAARLLLSALVIPILAKRGDTFGHQRILLVTVVLTADAAVGTLPGGWVFGWLGTHHAPHTRRPGFRRLARLLHGVIRCAGVDPAPGPKTGCGRVRPVHYRAHTDHLRSHLPATRGPRGTRGPRVMVGLPAPSAAAACQVAGAAHARAHRHQPARRPGPAQRLCGNRPRE
jgi:hypothetical protein